MDTTAAAKWARVTVATVRHWARMGAVSASKVAGRWDIDSQSLTRRIRAGHRPQQTDHPYGGDIVIRTRSLRADWPATATEVRISPRGDETEVHQIGAGATHAEAAAAARARLDRSTALRAEMAASDLADLTAPGHAASLVHRTMEDLTGTPSHAARGECHYCGLDPRTCDCR